MGWKLDMTGDTPDKLDQPQFAPAGVYWTELADATEDTKTGAMVLEFRVAHGPHTGLKITEKLQNPEFATDDTKAANIAAKAKKWINRLGAVPATAFGSADVEPDFIACIGREYVLQLEERSFTNDKGEAKKFTGCTYLGIWPLDHPDVPAAAVATLEAQAGKSLPPPRDGSVRGAPKTATKGGKAPATGTAPKPTGTGVSSGGGSAVDVAGLGL